jgi:hypothetical protein
MTVPQTIRSEALGVGHVRSLSRHGTSNFQVSWNRRRGAVWRCVCVLAGGSLLMLPAYYRPASFEFRKPDLKVQCESIFLNVLHRLIWAASYFYRLKPCQATYNQSSVERCENIPTKGFHHEENCRYTNYYRSKNIKAALVTVFNTFVSVRRLPVGSYTIVGWTAYLPRIGG